MIGLLEGLFPAIHCISFFFFFCISWIFAFVRDMDMIIPLIFLTWAVRMLLIMRYLSPHHRQSCILPSATIHEEPPISGKRKYYRTEQTVLRQAKKIGRTSSLLVCSFSELSSASVFYYLAHRPRCSAIQRPAAFVSEPICRTIRRSLSGRREEASIFAGTLTPKISMP